MIKVGIIVLLLVLSVPIGLLLAYLVRDELRKNKIMFKFISLVCFLLVILDYIFYTNFVVMLSLFFSGVVFFVLFFKSKKKNGRSNNWGWREKKD